jgi:hypothetical protein
MTQHHPVSPVDKLTRSCDTVAWLLSEDILVSVSAVDLRQRNRGAVFLSIH